MSLLSTLVDQLNVHTEALAGLHTDLGNYLKAEHENRTRAWMEAEGSDRTRDRTAAFHTLDITSDIFTTKAEIAALEARRLEVLTLIEIEHTQLKLQARLDT